MKRIVGNGVGGTRRNSMFDYVKKIRLDDEDSEERKNTYPGR